MAFTHQLSQLTLAHHRIFKIEAWKFYLPWMTGDTDVIQHPVIQGPVILKLQRTQWVSDAFQSIRDRVSEIVHGIDAPRIPGLMMNDTMSDPVQRRITHIHIRGGHVDFGSQGSTAICEFPCPHTLKQVHVFFRWPVPTGTGSARHC